jgi:hypothetical protein
MLRELVIMKIKKFEFWHILQKTLCAILECQTMVIWTVATEI